MNRTQITTAIVLIILIVVGIFFVKKFTDNGEKNIYEVLVQVREKKGTGDPAEDARTMLKKGDVLLVKKGEHKWSKTEKVSYLILKMNLTEKQVQKLTMPVEEKLSRKEKKKELEDFKKGRENISDEEIERYEEELDHRRETVVMRKYRINMEKYFQDFKPNDLLNGQPYKNEVNDWGIVQKK